MPILVLVCLGLGFISFLKPDAGIRDGLNALYDSMRLFTLESTDSAKSIPWLYEISRWLSPITLGLIVYSTLLLIARDKLILMRLTRMKDHTIICGLGNVGQQIAGDFLNMGKKVVIIERNEANDYITYFRDKGVVVLTENAADIKILEKARLKTARNLIAVSSNDTLNVEIAHKAFKMPTRENFKCFAHIQHRDFKDLFFCQNTLNSRVNLFSINETGARSILMKYPPDAFRTVAKYGATSPHVLIIGYENIGENLVNQLCCTAHYLNCKDVKISILADAMSKDSLDNFLKKYSGIRSLFDIKEYYWDFNNISADAIRQIESSDSLDVAYLCIEKDVAQYQIASKIESFFIQKPCPLVFCMPSQSSLVPLLFERYQKNQVDCTNFYIFNILEDSCNHSNIVNEELDLMARDCHENYNKTKEGPKTEWNNLDDFSYYSNISQADHIDVKLRAISCPEKIDSHKIDEIILYYTKTVIGNEPLMDALSEMEHRRWMSVHFINGWKYGSIRDNTKKLHPCLVPWKDLQDIDKDKDRKHIENIPALLGMVKQRLQ